MFGGVIFIWLFFVGLMAKQLKLYNIENVNGVIVKRWHWISGDYEEKSVNMIFYDKNGR